MSYEDREDAMNDYASEQQGEGREEMLEELRRFFTNSEKQTWSIEEVLKALEQF